MRVCFARSQRLETYFYKHDVRKGKIAKIFGNPKLQFFSLLFLIKLSPTSNARRLRSHSPATAALRRPPSQVAPPSAPPWCSTASSLAPMVAALTDDTSIVLSLALKPHTAARWRSRCRQAGRALGPLHTHLHNCCRLLPLYQAPRSSGREVRRPRRAARRSPPSHRAAW
jgi:hypothetical protein